MDDVIALYRSLTDEHLMLMLRALEMDAQLPGMSSANLQFIAGRIAIVQAEISRRSQYPDDDAKP